MHAATGLLGPVATAGLGPVEGAVGHAEQGLDIVAVLREGRHPQADRHPRRAGQGHHRLADFLGHLQQLR